MLIGWKLNINKETKALNIFEKFANQLWLFTFTEKCGEFLPWNRLMKSFVQCYAIESKKMKKSTPAIRNLLDLSRRKCFKDRRRRFVALDMALRFDLLQLISPHSDAICFVLYDDFSIFASSAWYFLFSRPWSFSVFPIIFALFVFFLSCFDVKKRFRIPHVAASTSAAPDDDEEREWMFPLMAMDGELQSTNDKSEPEDFSCFHWQEISKS